MRTKGGIDAAEGASEHDLKVKGIQAAGPIGPAALRWNDRSFASVQCDRDTFCFREHTDKDRRDLAALDA